MVSYVESTLLPSGLYDHTELEIYALLGCEVDRFNERSNSWSFVSTPQWYMEAKYRVTVPGVSDTSLDD